VLLLQYPMLSFPRSRRFRLWKQFNIVSTVLCFVPSDNDNGDNLLYFWHKCQICVVCVEEMQRVQRCVV
jgi:hypothetical protein